MDVVSTGTRRTFFLLLILLAGSGCAALIYEVVWFQLLQLVIGSSAVSLGLLLAAYMGGLCLGSALLPVLVSRKYHPLRVYAVLELGIGILGLLALFAVPLVGRIYVAGATQGLLGLVLRGLVAAVCLLPPTLLMGGSLPGIARWVHTTPKGISWIGLLYSANIAGAVFGCLLAGFYLLRVYDMAVGTYVAAAINVAVALISFLLAGRTQYSPREETSAIGNDQRPKGAALVYVAIALSGLCALGAQVVWTRLLSLLLGGTVYTFAIILAVFLIGLWGGSSAGSLLARRTSHARLALAGCQLLLALAIGWTAFALTYSLPYWPVDPWLSLNPVFNFQLDLVRCVWAILPATLLWGASFPLALAAAAGTGQDSGRLSGEVYAANTAGSIVGALIFSLVLIPNVGTLGSQQLLIALSVIAALIAALPLRGVPLPQWRSFAPAAGIAIAFAGLLTMTVADVPWLVVAYGRRVAPTARAFDLYPDERPPTVLYRGEGINSSVVIVERAGERQFYVSGKAEASTASLDMRLERMMGHVPALIHPNPRNVLIVGFGAGITAGSFVPYPEIENIVICEIEPFIPPASTEYFGAQNNRVLHHPRTRMVYDDARHFIFMTDEKFDVITTDPIHPWVKGTSTLYSKEYYELVKTRLNPGGVVAQWLPIYDSDAETVKSELATFFSVFPNGTVWSNFINGSGTISCSSDGWTKTPISVDEIQQRLDRPDYAAVLASTSEVGFRSAVEVLATYAGRATDLRSYLANAQINEDLNMRLQYLAGLGLNSMSHPQDLPGHAALPQLSQDLLVGSGGRIDALRTLLRPRN